MVTAIHREDNGSSGRKISGGAVWALAVPEGMNACPQAIPSV